MKEPYNEGIASHIDPESCVDLPRGDSEALTGESAGGLLSSENRTIWRPSSCFQGEGNTARCVMQAASCSSGVVELGMRGHSLHENRDASERKLHGQEAKHDRGGREG